MGMSIIGAVANVDKATMIANVEASFNLKLSFDEQEVWSEHDGGVSGDSIVIYSANGASLAYFPGVFFSEDLEQNFRNLISKVDKGVAFFGNETSMAFGLMFGENKRVTAEDFYLFEEDFTQEGPNILNLGEDNDIIHDGFFPTIEKYVGLMEEETKVEMYRYSKGGADAAIEPSKPNISLLNNPLEVEENIAVNSVPPVLPTNAENVAMSSEAAEMQTAQGAPSQSPPPIVAPPMDQNAANYGNDQSASNPSLTMDPSYYVIPVSAGLRFVNALIDGIVLQIVDTGMGWVFGLLFSQFVLDLDYSITVIILNLLFTIAVSIAYHFIMENANGSTLGKLVTQTRVVHETGRKATSKEIFIRSLCRYIPFDAFSFLGSGVGWHDTISKTRVVSKENYDQIIMLSENQYQ